MPITLGATSMHLDMTPLVPWGRSNPLLGAVSLSVLHIGCVIAGLVGLCAWLVRIRWNADTQT